MKQILVAIVMVLCGSTAFSQTDEKGIVLGVERSTAAAFSKHDLVFLTAAFADNITVIPVTGDVITKQQLLQTVQSITSVTVSDMKVRIESNTAIITGIRKVTGKDDNGNAYSNTTRFTHVLLKTKGEWQMIASQETTMEP